MKQTDIKIGSKWENVHGLTVTVKENRSGVSPEILVDLPFPNKHGNMWESYDWEPFSKYFRHVENSDKPGLCDIYPGQRWRTVDGATIVVTRIQYVVYAHVGDKEEGFGEDDFRRFFTPIDIRKKPEAQ